MWLFWLIVHQSVGVMVVPRVQWKDDLGFVQSIVDKGQPCIIEASPVVEWPALKRWSLSGLAQRLCPLSMPSSPSSMETDCEERHCTVQGVKTSTQPLVAFETASQPWQKQIAEGCARRDNSIDDDSEPPPAWCQLVLQSASAAVRSARSWRELLGALERAQRAPDAVADSYVYFSEELQHVSRRVARVTSCAYLSQQHQQQQHQQLACGDPHDGVTAEPSPCGGGAAGTADTVGTVAAGAMGGSTAGAMGEAMNTQAAVALLAQAFGSLGAHTPSSAALPSRPPPSRPLERDIDIRPFRFTVPALEVDTPSEDEHAEATSTATATEGELQDDSVLVQMWFNQRGLVAHAHYDAEHNFFVQITGRKRFRLFAPGAQTVLGLYPFLHARQRQVLFNVSAFVEESRSVGGHAGAQYELGVFAFAPLELHPGEVLYLPPYHFHQVEALDSSVSLNMWTAAAQERIFHVRYPFEEHWSALLRLSAVHEFIVHMVLDLNHRHGFGRSCAADQPVYAALDRLMSERFGFLYDDVALARAAPDVPCGPNRFPATSDADKAEKAVRSAVREPALHLARQLLRMSQDVRWLQLCNMIEYWSHWAIQPLVTSVASELTVDVTESMTVGAVLRFWKQCFILT